MKRMVMAAVAAVALAGTATPEASAWCKFNFGGGVNIGLETGGRYVKRNGVTRISYPPPYANNNGGFGGGFGGFGGAEGFAQAEAPTAPEAPVSAPNPVTPASYYYYPSYDYSYGN
jgi:hypothetical protein